MSKLPSATETEDLQVLHVFQIHGIPQKTFFLTGICSFLLKYGRLSARLWMQLLVSCLDTTSYFEQQIVIRCMTLQNS